MNLKWFFFNVSVLSSTKVRVCIDARGWKYTVITALDFYILVSNTVTFHDVLYILTERLQETNTASHGAVTFNKALICKRCKFELIWRGLAKNVCWGVLEKCSAFHMSSFFSANGCSLQEQCGYYVTQSTVWNMFDPIFQYQSRSQWKGAKNGIA